MFQQISVELPLKKRRRSGAPSCRLDCNDAGCQAISESALLFPLYRTSRSLIKAEQANGGYGVELSDGFDEGVQSGHKMVKKDSGVIIITP